MFQSQDDQDNFESFTPATQDCYSYDQAPDGGKAQNINSFSPLRKKNRHNPVFQYMPSQGNSQLDGPMITGDGDSSNEGQFQPHGGAFLLSQDSQFNFSQLSQGFSDRLEQMSVGRPGQQFKSGSILGPGSSSYLMSEAPFALHQAGNRNNHNNNHHNNNMDGNSNLSASSQVSSQGSDSFMMLTSTSHPEDSLLSYPTDGLPTPILGIACTQPNNTSTNSNTGGNSTTAKIPINTNTGLSIQVDYNSFSIPNLPSSKAINAPVGGNNTKKNHKNNPANTTVETERQVDLRAVTPNPFLQYHAGPLVYNYPAEDYFQQLLSTTNLMNSLPKLNKIWISPFEERSRYTTDFEECAQIGTGTFSKVTCVRHRLDGMLYAIKNIKERIVSKRQGALLLREVAALSLLTALECPNLIQYYSSWIEEGKIYIQLEWCNLGSLEDIIAKNPSRFSIFANRQTSPSTRNNRSNSVNMMLDNRNRSDSYQSIESMEAYTPIGLPETTSIFDFINQTMEGISEVFAWHILKVLSQALHFMHSRGMVHLDIRPANIFLQSAPSLTPEFNAMSSAESPSGKSLFSTVMASLSQTSLSHDSTSAGQRGGLQRQFSNDEVPSRTTTTSSKSKDTMQKEVEDLILNGHYVLKVGDLGHVRGLFETGFINEGETRYCPRELINSDPSTLDLTKADVFSLAASVYELCLGRYLGSNGDEEMVEWHSIRDGVLDEDFLKKYSPQLTATIRQMLHPDPSQRLSCFAIYTTSMERLSTYKTTQDEKDLLIRRLLEENNRLAGELQELRRNQQI